MTTVPSDRDWTAFAAEAARSVPAYATHLREHGVDPADVERLGIDALPPTTKPGYVRRHPLPARCRGGAVGAGTMFALSSGSSGTPTAWPRDLRAEAEAALPFERVLADAFAADRRRTLAVVCFPLGLWVGGLYTLGALQHLARTGMLLTIAAPGNSVDGVLAAVRQLGPDAEQLVLLGYPPFVKDVIDAGNRAGIGWPALDVHLVFAGEVFSETWRDAVCARAGIADPATGTAGLYGTADAGVLAYETPESIRLRRRIDASGATSRVFGKQRLPSLMRYEPGLRRFDTAEGQLLLTCNGPAPLVRYAIGDTGGRAEAAELAALCADAEATHAGATHADAGGPGSPGGLPYVWLFGRELFALSLYGANVYPETIALGLERHPGFDRLTGRFVIEILAGERPRLGVTVETVGSEPGGADPDSADPDSPDSPGLPDPAGLAQSILAALREQNGEYLAYVPEELHLPEVRFRPRGDPEYFPQGVKHRYVRT